MKKQGEERECARGERNRGDMTRQNDGGKERGEGTRRQEREIRQEKRGQVGKNRGKK
jgi:hypothetical protein